MLACLLVLSPENSSAVVEQNVSGGGCIKKIKCWVVDDNGSSPGYLDSARLQGHQYTENGQVRNRIKVSVAVEVTPNATHNFTYRHYGVQFFFKEPGQQDFGALPTNTSDFETATQTPDGSYDVGPSGARVFTYTCDYIGVGFPPYSLSMYKGTLRVKVTAGPPRPQGECNCLGISDFEVCFVKNDDRIIYVSSSSANAFPENDNPDKHDDDFEIRIDYCPNQWESNQQVFRWLIPDEENGDYSVYYDGPSYEELQNGQGRHTFWYELRSTNYELIVTLKGTVSDKWGARTSTATISLEHIIEE